MLKERNVLIGNGINIAFSNNDDYKKKRANSYVSKILRKTMCL